MITETRIEIYPRTLNNILLTNEQQQQQQSSENTRYYLQNYNWTCIILLVIICILCITLGIYSIVKFT